ncbi:MAG TPA: hypothetical protein VFR67_12735 [Pilimelia sp.]|nr:hypothetical protein [Pilimelia sp.]
MNWNPRRVARLALAIVVGLALMVGLSGPVTASPQTTRSTSPSAALGRPATKLHGKIIITIRPATAKEARQSSLQLWPPIGPPPPIATPWVVEATNATGVDFQEIWLAWNRFTNPISEVWPKAPFYNGMSQSWTIDICGSINLFAIALVNYNVIEFNTGDQTKESCLEQVLFHN